jgi:hypothetical protein
MSCSENTYVDRPEAGSVAGGHIGVEGLNGVCPRHLTILLVHVVGARPRVVTDPNTKVLDPQGVLLLDLSKLLDGIVRCAACGLILPPYLLDRHNLASGLLDLPQATQEIPVSRLGNRNVRGKNDHAVKRRARVGLCGQVPADNLVLVKTT